MLQEKKHIFIAIGVIILVGTMVIFYFVQQSRPQNVIENKLKIELPSSSKILNYTYYRNGGYFKAKISVEMQSIDALKEQLNNLLGGISKQKYPEHINFKNTCGWWDLDKQDIVVSYNTFVSGEKKWFGYSPKSRDVWAFISKDKEGQYYFYISY